jgi:hypothetical protein
VEEVIKETKKLQAKTWSNMLEMIQVKSFAYFEKFLEKLEVGFKRDYF